MRLSAHGRNDKEKGRQFSATAAKIPSWFYPRPIEKCHFSESNLGIDANLIDVHVN